MKRLQEALGESKAADRIQEGPWWDIVMKVLSEQNGVIQKYLVPKC